MKMVMTLKKLIYLLAVAVLLGGMYVNHRRPIEAGADVLRIWVTQEEYQVLSQVNPNFEAQHNVTIKMEVVDRAEMLARLPLAMETPFTPDIINATHMLIPKLVEQGLIAPITDVFAEFNVLPLAGTALRVTNDFYGIPYRAQTDILFYDREQFPEGIPPLSIGENPERYSLAINYQTIYHVVPFIRGFGGYIVGLDNFGNINFLDIGLHQEASVMGIQHMVNLLDEGLISDQETNIYEAFIFGDANLLVAPMTALDFLQRMMPHVGYQAIPNFLSNEIPYTYMQMDTYQLTSGTTNRELAIQYLRFLASDEVATIRYELTRAIAPIDHQAPISQDLYYTVVKRQLHRAFPVPDKEQFNYLYRPFEQAINQIVEHSEEIQFILEEAVIEAAINQSIEHPEQIQFILEEAVRGINHLIDAR